MKGRGKQDDTVSTETKTAVLQQLIQIFSDMEHQTVQNSGSDVIKTCTKLQPYTKLEGITVAQFEKAFIGDQAAIARLDTIYAELGATAEKKEAKATSGFTHDLTKLDEGQQVNVIGYFKLDPRVAKNGLKEYGFSDEALAKINYRQAIMLYDVIFDVMMPQIAGKSPAYRDQLQKFIGEAISTAIENGNLGMEKAGDYKTDPTFLANLQSSQELIQQSNLQAKAKPGKAATVPATTKAQAEKKPSRMFSFFSKKEKQAKSAGETPAPQKGTDGYKNK